MHVQIVLQVQTELQEQPVLLTQEQLGLLEHVPEPAPVTQLHVQTAPAGIGEPHGSVYVTPPMVYVTPLPVLLAAGSIRQIGSWLPSGNDHSLMVLSLLHEASSRPSGLMANINEVMFMELPAMRVLSSAPDGNDRSWTVSS